MHDIGVVRCFGSGGGVRDAGSSCWGKEGGVELLFPPNDSGVSCGDENLVDGDGTTRALCIDRGLMPAPNGLEEESGVGEGGGVIGRIRGTGSGSCAGRSRGVDVCVCVTVGGGVTARICAVVVGVFGTEDGVHAEGGFKDS